MKSHYSCGTCKRLLEATEEYFHLCNLKKVSKKPECISIAKCKSCANDYSERYRNNLKDKKLTRSLKNAELAGAVLGTVYIISPDVTGTPYKIGITGGTNIENRKTALQTSHWMELKVVWKSTLLNRADLLEKKLHSHFEKKRIRGEWFSLSRQDIDNIPNLVEQFGVE